MTKGFRAIGASNHATHDRETNDFYATDPKCGIDIIHEIPELKDIWECACGEGHLAKSFGDKLSKATDIIDRGYGKIADFFGHTEKWKGDIVTNPPYSSALEFTEKALSLLEEGRFYCAFLKLIFLEGQKRRKFFEENPPKFVYVYSQRQKCALGGNFNVGASSICYAWFVWEKGFKGETILKWI